MEQKYSLFSYKKGNSFLHKCPSWAKLIFIPLINILFLCLPSYFAVSFVILQFILACCLGFSIKEQLWDLRPIFFYAILLFFMQILLWAFAGAGKEAFIQNFSWSSEKETVLLLVKLFAIMQSASLVFKTSTSLEIRNGIETIELSIRKLFHLKPKTSFTNIISMFLNFLPMVSKIWDQSKRAWFARGGKNGITMYMKLLPVLFSVGMKKAYNQTKAISIRSGM